MNDGGKEHGWFGMRVIWWKRDVVKSVVDNCGVGSSGDGLLYPKAGEDGRDAVDVGRQFRWYMFRRGISYVPGCDRTCSRMSWYEPPVMEDVPSDEARA